MPIGFKKIASSAFCEIAAYDNGRVFGLQFHPEVVHTENGQKILENFVGICGDEGSWRIKDQIGKLIDERGRRESVLTSMGENVLLSVKDSGVSIQKKNLPIEMLIYRLF